MQLNKKCNAFTLVELSVSILIISAIIAFITVGKSLQKQAEIRNIATEFNIIQSAISNFKLQYNALPGDINNAATIWPTSATANGNGDNQISSNRNATYSSSPLGNEDVYLFQHLYLAEMISMNFNGGAQSPRYIVANNIYPSKTSRAGHAVFYGKICELFDSTNSLCSNSNFYNYKGQLLEYGNINTSSTYTNGSVLNAADSYQLDLKIDDGLPGNGKLMTYKGIEQTSTVCVDSTLKYLTNDDSINCRQILVID